MSIIKERGLSGEARAVKPGLDVHPAFHTLLWLLLLRFNQSNHSKFNVVPTTYTHGSVILMLVAGAFHTLHRVLGMHLLIRNLFWMAQVSKFGAQHRSRRKLFLREGKGNQGRPCRQRGERIAGRE